MAARTLFTSFMVANRTTRAPVSASQFLVPFGVSQIFRMAGEALHRPPDMLPVAAQTKVTAKDTFDAIQAADPTSKKRSFNPGTGPEAASGALAKGRALADCIGVICLLLSCFIECTVPSRWRRMAASIRRSCRHDCEEPPPVYL